MVGLGRVWFFSFSLRVSLKIFSLNLFWIHSRGIPLVHGQAGGGGTSESRRPQQWVIVVAAVLSQEGLMRWQIEQVPGSAHWLAHHTDWYPLQAVGWMEKVGGCQEAGLHLLFCLDCSSKGRGRPAHTRDGHCQGIPRARWSKGCPAVGPNDSSRGQVCALCDCLLWPHSRHC